MEYIFIKPSDSELITVIYRILFRCGADMAKQLLFHWIPPYSKRAIRKACDTRNVIIVRDGEEFTSTFQMWIDSENNLYVGKIATDPKFEGRGIGKNNMLFIEGYGRENGCSSIKLDVYVKSKRAVRFYQRNGFEIIGEKRSIRFKEYIMSKML